MERKENGITLIAIVITIIIILILAAIGISSNTKIISRVVGSRNTYEGTEKNEAVGLNDLGSSFKNELNQIKSDTQTEKGNLIPQETVKLSSFESVPNTWTNGEVRTKITDENKNYTLQYKTNSSNGAWNNYINPIISSSNETIYARFSNGLVGGSTASRTITNIDKEPPIVSTALNSSEITSKGFTLNVGVVDTASGLSKITWYYKKSWASSYTNAGTDVYTAMNGSTTGTNKAVTKSKAITNLKTGTYNAYAEVWDVAGNRTTSNTIDIELSYVGCYADIDGNGIIDGIIFADLAQSKNVWFGTGYSYTAQTGLKSYYIKESAHKQKLGTGNVEITASVIAPVSGTTGKDRFYIMALEDFKQGPRESFYWYNDSFRKLDRPVNNSDSDFGEGKTNTIKMINDWNNKKYGEQTTSSSGKSYIDMWGAIQDHQYELVKNENDSKKWFIPSKSELAAIADCLFNVLNIARGSYSNYGLNAVYWSSSQYDNTNVYIEIMGDGSSQSLSVNYNIWVRFVMTF